MSESKPIEIFCCVAESDQPFLEKLSTRLTVQQKRGTITLWDRSQVEGGKPVNREIQRHLARARIFLLLIGPDFLKDDYCYNQVMRTALERHVRGAAITIPVIVSHANWQDVDILKGIQVLPGDGIPINSQPDKDKALWEVAEEISEVIKGLAGSPVEPDTLSGGGNSGNSEWGPDGSGGTPPTGKGPGKNPISIPPLDPVTVKKAPIWIHFLKFMVTQPLGWALFGVIILLSGVLWGISSPTLSYIETPQGTTLLNFIPVKNGDLYISAPENPSTFYVAHCNDLSPHIDCTQLPSHLKMFFRARPEPISANSSVRGITGRNIPVGQIYVIEELTLYNQNNNSLGTYTASDYNPDHTYYESRWWPVAVVLIAVGLLIVYVAFFVWRRRRRGA